MELLKANSESLVNLVTEQNGSLVFFDERIYQKSICDEDVFVYLDDRGKATAETIKSIIQKNIKIISLTELKTIK